jgi:hypothetical protein
MKAIWNFIILMTLMFTPICYTKAQSLLENPAPPKKAARFAIPKKSWLIMTVFTYTAVSLDMHATANAVERKRKYPSYYRGFPESNPLARSFVTLPRPAYYALGFALATGINWLGYRMSKSPRLQKVWWLPQSISITANSLGYKSQRID